MMDLQATADGLYIMHLIIAMILLGTLLFNNIMLYKQKIRDTMSLMLISSVVMCAFEILWDLCDGHPALSALTYAGGTGYAMSFVAFGVFFNRYFLERYDMTPEKRWQNILYYTVFPAAFFVICLTTPVTKLLFRVDDNGVLQEMILFRTLFYGILLAYLIPALALSVYFTLFGEKTRPSAAKAAKSMLFFGVLAPAIYLLQLFIMGSDSDYIPLSISLAAGMVYLVTNVSTNTLMESEAEVQAVENELRIAAKIQEDALPPVAPKFSDYLDITLRASMNTAREVGGDMYDYFQIDRRRLCFLIADVSGKGTPAALFMMTVKTMIKDYALSLSDTAEILTMVNRRLSENNDEGMFATAWLGILDTETMTLQYTNAGHDYPVFRRRGEKCCLLKKVHGLFLAGMDDTRYRHDEIRLNPGDLLLLYTDGVTDAHSPENGLYGTGRLMHVVEENAGRSGEEILSDIIRDVGTFSEGVPQFDDITMMILTVK